MKALLYALCIAICALAAPATAQVVIQGPGAVGPAWRPYGPGFGGGVVIGPRDGCRNLSCPHGAYQNRPFHRRYYDRYFEVPTPRYSRPDVLGGSGVIGGSHLDDIPGTAGKHRRWCSDRYRSYRPSDDSFQPFDRPRRRCISPYS